MNGNELGLAPEETSALLITNKRNIEGATFKLGNAQITLDKRI